MRLRLRLRALGGADTVPSNQVSISVGVFERFFRTVGKRLAWRHPLFHALVVLGCCRCLCISGPARRALERLRDS